MSGHLPDRRPSGSIIEQAGSSLVFGAMVSGIAVVGITYAGLVALKQAGSHALKRIGPLLPIGGPI
jgi:hypothetical protein